MLRVASSLFPYLLIGTATVYAGPAGQPLYCDHGEGLIYDITTSPWVAIDITEYTAGRAECGDELLITFQDGQALRAQALDAGPLYPHYIDQWRLSIVVDVPAHLAASRFEGLSTPATVLNLSAAKRALCSGKPQACPGETP